MGEEFTIIRKPAPVTSPTLRDLLAVLFRQRRLALLSFYSNLFYRPWLWRFRTLVPGALGWGKCSQARRAGKWLSPSGGVITTAVSSWHLANCQLLIANCCLCFVVPPGQSPGKTPFCRFFITIRTASPNDYHSTRPDPLIWKKRFW
jgi:hypothetical protein